MISQESHIAQTIQKLIVSIKPDASASFQSEIKQYSRKVLGSFVSKSATESTQQLKDKIIAKVSPQYDTKATLQCQDAINRIMTNPAIQKKAEVLKMIYKTSEQLNNGKDFSKIFQESRVTTANSSANQSTIQDQIKNNTSLSFLKNKKGEGLGSVDRGCRQEGISEMDILKQITYVLQNIDSNLISEDSEGFSLKPNVSVQSPISAMVKYICDIGWLYRKIRCGLHERGTIEKALGVAVQEELKGYYEWLAVIENMIKSKELTMRRLVMWCYEPMERIKWIAMVLDSVQSFRGCQILSVVNSYRPQGNQAINELLNRILGHLVQPLLQFVHNWVYRGELVDTHLEFFVGQSKRIGENMDWSERFFLNEANIPDILDREAALMIFDAGKTLNFLKNNCQCNLAVETPFIDPTRIISSNICESLNILSSEFKQWLRSVYQELSQKLVSVLTDHFCLRFHLQSMKQFFLMGKGDFIQHIAETLKDHMTRKKHEVYEHTLDGYISDARDKCFTDFELARHLNPRVVEQHFKDSSFKGNVINRLLAKKIDFGESLGEGFADCFNFQYAMDKIEPLYCILTPDSYRNYQKIFHSLWKVKRVEQTLKEIWIIHLKGYPKDVKAKDVRPFAKILHKCHLLHSALNHFVSNFFGYLMIAIEACWDRFFTKIEDSGNVDSIIQRHAEMQRELLDITFNSSSKQGLMNSLRNLFKVAEQFKNFELNLQSVYSDYYEQLRSYRNEQKLQSRGMSFSEGELKVPVFEDDEYLKRVAAIEEIYAKSFRSFFEILNKEAESMNVLAFRLDFSEYYTESYLVEGKQIGS